VGIRADTTFLTDPTRKGRAPTLLHIPTPGRYTAGTLRGHTAHPTARPLILRCLRSPFPPAELRNVPSSWYRCSDPVLNPPAGSQMKYLRGFTLSTLISRHTQCCVDSIFSLTRCSSSPTSSPCTPTSKNYFLLLLISSNLPSNFFLPTPKSIYLQLNFFHFNSNNIYTCFLITPTSISNTNNFTSNFISSYL